MLIASFASSFRNAVVWSASYLARILPARRPVDILTVSKVLSMALVVATQQVLELATYLVSAARPGPGGAHKSSRPLLCDDRELGIVHLPELMLILLLSVPPDHRDPRQPHNQDVCVSAANFPSPLARTVKIYIFSAAFRFLAVVHSDNDPACPSLHCENGKKVTRQPKWKNRNRQSTSKWRPELPFRCPPLGPEPLILTMPTLLEVLRSTRSG